MFEVVVFVERAPVAGARERNGNGRTEGGLGPGGERDDSVGEVNGLVGIVRDEEDRLFVLLADPGKFVLERAAGERVEGAERFVEEEDTGLHREGAGDGNTLAHAAGEFARDLPEGGREVDGRDVFFDVGAAGLGRPGWEDLVDGESDVFVDGEPREEAVVLEHDAAVGAGAVHAFTVKEDFAGVGFGEAGEERHKGGLAGAGVADDGDELAFLDLEVDVVEDVAARPGRAEGFADVLDGKKGHGRRVRQIDLKRASITLIRRSRTKPTRPMVMMQRMICS